MFKHIFLFMSILYFYAGTASAKPSLIFLGNVSHDKNFNTKYCSQLTDITQNSADDLARSWKIPSASITLRSAKLSGSICCITLDTPKGPFVNMAWEYYLFGTEIIANMNNRGYLEGEQNQGCIR